MITPIFWIIPVASILALVFAWFFFRQMMKESEGHYGSFLPSFAFSFLFCDKYAVFFRMKHYYLRKSFSTSLFLLYLQMNNKGS